jgi:AraC-like DNA-binding protein
MTGTGRDRLRELLDLIVGSVERTGGGEQRERGASLAGRAFLSRYHFDRLVAAALGEPPGAFRRRLLLERAAYQLRIGDQPVTAVAFTAGYESVDGFARAFRRAYGCPPSVLRREPAIRLALPATNGIHFHPPGGLRLPADAERTDMDIATRLLEHDCWLVGQLLDRAGELTDEQLDRPITLNVESIDDDMTPRSLLSALVATKEMWTASVDGRQVPSHADSSIAGLRQRFAVAGPAFLQLARAVRSRGDEGATFIDATCEPPHTFTYGGMFSHVLTFSAYRRTLVCLALHDMGVTELGLGDPMGYPQPS